MFVKILLLRFERFLGHCRLTSKKMGYKSRIHVIASHYLRVSWPTFEGNLPDHFFVQKDFFGIKIIYIKNFFAIFARFSIK